MDLAYYANLAEVLGTLAIIVSLIYVAVQIRQHTRVTRLSTGQNVSRDLRDSLAVVANDMTMASIHLRAMTNVSSLAPEEKHRFYIFMNNAYRGYENAYYQNLQGALDPHVWETVVGNLVIGKYTAGYESFWRDRKQIFSKAFQDFYDNELPGSEIRPLDAYESAENVD